MRSWVDADGTITGSGRCARREIEATTDRICTAGLDREATGHMITIEEPLLAVARGIEAAGGIAYPNPSGVQQP